MKVLSFLVTLIITSNAQLSDVKRAIQANEDNIFDASVSSNECGSPPINAICLTNSQFMLEIRSGIIALTTLCKNVNGGCFFDVVYGNVTYKFLSSL